ncbi:hypothetical protein [Thalassoglobus neptunius]|uniref:hypothetical protein n=1 Tax=Thalassoglobus neptunius TaxID=1938619 RepID=UPI0011B4A404|nr:hypothetical protein [Thalassoglobus neptunius]
MKSVVLRPEIFVDDLIHTFAVMKYELAVSIREEELPKPQHLADTGARAMKSDPYSAFVPVEQHSKEAAGHMLYEFHIDPDLADVVFVDQLHDGITQQGKVGTIPDFHFPDSDDGHIIILGDRQAVCVLAFRHRSRCCLV